MDNLPAHKVAGVRNTLEKAGALSSAMPATLLTGSEPD